MGLGIFMMCTWRHGNSLAVAHAISVAKAREMIVAEMGVPSPNSEAAGLMYEVLTNQPEMFRGPNVEVVVNEVPIP